MPVALLVPRQITVAAAENGQPATITLKCRLKQVSHIRNIWRIDDEWWRNEISRLYFDVELSDGLVATVFHDLVSGTWYQQSC